MLVTIDDIKEAVQAFADSAEGINHRDVAGLHKIQYELDLLKRLEVAAQGGKSKRRKKGADEESE